MIRAYRMRRHTLTAPAVRNDGADSGYPAAIRAALLAAGIDGWTEYETAGYWRGKREPGRTFEIFRVGTKADARRFAVQLARIGRETMPDQEAIQVTTAPKPWRLLEG